MSTFGKWTKRVLLVLLIALLVVILLAAFVPIPPHPSLTPEQSGAGASSVEPSYTGLQRSFPALNEPAENPTSPAKVELGRQLFFDPILSHNNDLSCAACHHPDFGFADGQALAIGAGGTGAAIDRTGGTVLTRSTMSLWNAGYATKLFWDGRAATLEEQANTPITHPDEMAAKPDELVSKLRANLEYVKLFDQAFGGGSEAVTYDNVRRALASFERTLVTHDSPFDRYAAGQVDALTAPQRRGLGVFRSAATRCFECHAAPTFGSDNFFVTGVPGLPHDPGRQAIAHDGLDGAFKAPTLRNIALTAPYMHNGAFKTLDEVIDFYAKGGGRDTGVQSIDRHVQGFDLTPQEKADLIAFLYGLTDESQLPAIPDHVPSGLPLVSHLQNPAWDAVQKINAPQTAQGTPPQHSPTIVTVQPGETIQAAVDRAGHGDTIEVPFGTYDERVVIDLGDIKLIGVPNAQGEWPTLDGEGELPDGVIASGNNFEMANFNVKNYRSNGVLVEGATGVYLHDLFTADTGVYGVYPVRSTNILIERVKATGTNDAGIYAGKSENVVIRDSEAWGNVIGIEVENTVNAEIYNNHAHDNSLGIFVDLLPQLPSKASLNTKVYNNLSENNNGVNNAPPASAQSLVRTGTGLLLLGTDYAEVFSNTIRGNKTGGLGMFSVLIGFSKNELDVEPNPDNNKIYGNTFTNNGYDADPFIKDMLGSGFDIIWDGSGYGHHFDQPGASSFPPILPRTDWPLPLQNLYYRSLERILSLVQ